jgi:transcriptional regulator with XRE-family HTH domain
MANVSKESKIAGQRIRELREERNITISKLCKSLEISRSYLSKIETGERNVQTKVIYNCSLIFDVSTDYLLGKTDEIKEGRGMSEDEKRINVLVKDDEISLMQMYQIAQSEGLGDLNNVNDKETIGMYIADKMKDNVPVSHILRTIEVYDFVELFEIWLGNSSITPIPIRTKKDLKKALGY